MFTIGFIGTDSGKFSVEKELSVAGVKGGGEFLFDFLRTSLAGLVLESATSSGLVRTPSGTTWNYKTGGIIHQLIEQPGHAG
ncbi:hypothetical protein TNCV_1826361 [Trichonephila clavipes]|nr:hypothetical protein TNCV_1826361 [Trichonephila clavipes]